MPKPPPLRHTRAHDYRHLIRRWRRAIVSKGLSLKPYCSVDENAIYVVETRKPNPSLPWIYFSAGIHGDEVAGTEALLTWFERHPATQPLPFNTLIFPCLNPWGLLNNSRFDANGCDLNRTYHDDAIPQTAAHKAVLAGRRFALALTLHEDFDAPGMYLYEIRRQSPAWGEALLAAASPHVPIDSRKSIEGSRSRAGLIRRRIRRDLMPHHPEAFTLHFDHAARTFTIETPSELHLDQRVDAQLATMTRAIQLCLAER